MARPIPTDLRDKVANFLKEECLKAGGPVSPPMADIAEAVGEKRTNAEKIMRMIQLLEKRGTIRVYRFEGGVANKYEFINDSAQALMAEVKQKNTEQVNEAVTSLNDAVRNVMELYGSAVKDSQDKTAELIYIKEMLKNLEFHGTTANGEILFKASRNSTLHILLETLKNE